MENVNKEKEYYKKYSTGLSLSGGGYRAAAYHLGTLRALHAMNVRNKIEVLSTISGGSIIGAYYCLNGENFDSFSNGLEKQLQKSVIGGVLRSFTFIALIISALAVLGAMIYVLFTPYAWMSFVLLAAFLIILFRFQFSIFPVSKIIEEMYDRLFFGKKKLENLNDKMPMLVAGSTNLDTARPFVFSKLKVGDSAYEWKKGNGVRGEAIFKTGIFPVSRAVMASSCVPFAFTPVSMAKKYYLDPNQDFRKYVPSLVDGGVYDNQGIHTISQGNSRFYCSNIVITSDAGAGFSGAGMFHNTLQLLARTCDVFMQRIKNVQLVDNLYDTTTASKRQLAYFSLGWDFDRCIPEFIANLKEGSIPQSTIDAHGIKENMLKPVVQEKEIEALLKANTGYANIRQVTPEQLKLARSVSTNLTALSKKQIDALAGHAQSMTMLQVRLYCPALFV